MVTKDENTTPTTYDAFSPGVVIPHLMEKIEAASDSALSALESIENKRAASEKNSFGQTTARNRSSRD